MPHYIWMVSSRDAEDAMSTLTRDAQPLRHSLIRYFARRLRNTCDVEDLVQEVFARVVARDSTTPIGHLGKYLHQTAASVLADYARRRSAQRSELHVAFNPDLHADADFDPERILAGKEDVHVAATALLSLPERTRIIFLLRRIDDVPSRAIAVQLGISVRAVEKHLFRAVQHLSNIAGASS